MHNSVPFLDLVTPHVELEEELTSVFRRALQTAGFIGGPMVEEFEQAFATFCDASHAIAIGSGTDALRFAIMSLWGATWRRRRYRSTYVYRHHGGDLAGRSYPGICRH